jgi:hypothetical protein
MQRIRQLGTGLTTPEAPISLKSLAHLVGLTPPFSTLDMIKRLQMPLTFHQGITTPSGTALGGTVDLTLFSDGRYSFTVHMHDSGFDAYDFRVRCAFTTPAGLILLFQASGHTDGTGSSLLGTIHRDFDHHEDGPHELIQPNWLDIRGGSMSVSKSYEDAGALSTVEDIAKDLLGFLVADVTFGAGLALVIAVSAEISKAADANFVGPGGLIGVAVAGGVVWTFGPSAIIAAVVAGVAAGAITEALIKHRQLHQDEYDFAREVFGNTLPPIEKLFVTNLSHGGGRKYTWPNVDGNILLNLGDALDDPRGPMGHTEGQSTDAGAEYTTRGQVLIHELTHAWQIARFNFVPGLLCRVVSGGSSYVPGPPNSDWRNDFGLEQQARVVDRWFGTYAKGWTDIADLKKKLSTQPAMTDPYFHYIANHIRLAQN